ncbi:MAG: carboxypeptidase-like regulatory domain-containing protein [Bacteroides sp.]
MKTRLTLFLLCFVYVTLASAQNKRIVVSGNILDDETKAFIEQATVQLLALPDSSFVSGVVSLRNGSFTLPAAKAGKYVMKVSFVGYQPLFKSIQLYSAHPFLNIGKLNLVSDAILLSEAVIVAEASQVVVVQDTTVYNASAYRVPEGSMLEDLVKKLPGAEIDDDGKVTINGKEVKKIMVDGKEFFTNDPKLALKNLPVKMIENVKAYDKKSDLARVTGIDDGEEEAVLDLTVKKGMKKGWFGNFIGGYGNKERYEVGAMANRFTDNTQFSVLGSANNTNNQGFSEFGDAGQGLGGNAGSGINTSKLLGLNFAKDTKKIELGGNVQYGNSDRDSRMKSSTETFLKNGSSYSNNKSNSRRKRNDISADFRLEWRPDSMTNIIFRPSASYSKTRNRSDGLSATLNNEMDSVNSKSSNASSISDNVTARGNLQINRKLNSKGRNITLRVNYGYNDGETDKYSYSDTYYYLAQKDSIRNQYVDNWSNGYNYKVQMSYTEPIFTNRFLQFSYSYQYKRSRSEKYTYNWDKELEEYSHLPDTASSNCYRNEYSNQQANISLRTVREKYYYNIGMSVEPQKSTSVTYDFLSRVNFE